MTELNLHPEPERLEAYIEGTLEDAELAVLESHLVSCPRCQAELEEWRGLFTALDALPELEPSPGFADRVMASVKMMPAPATGLARARWWPRTTKGWSVVAAFLALPVVGLSSAVAWVLAQPWATSLTAQGLLSFATTKLATGLSWLTGEAESAILTNALVQSALAMAKQYAATVGTGGLGLAAAAFCLTAGWSAWVLYQNLIRNSHRDAHYAPYTI